MPAMFGCSTVCPKCQHQFTCCPPTPCCNATTRRARHGLSGGGLVTAITESNECSSPQISPSVPLVFVMPSFATLQPAFLLPEARPEAELQHLNDIVEGLRQSGWYHEGISYQRSQELLKYTPLGTFLVRDSSDPRYLYSLSVQTERGPTSVRIYYVNGYFRLDAQKHVQHAMPLFPSVVELVDHYVTQSRASKNSAHVWVDPGGKLYSAILLDKPLLRHDTIRSLKHLARLAIHSAIQSTTRPRLSLLPPSYTQLKLPPSVTAYLAEYPYSY